MTNSKYNYGLNFGSRYTLTKGLYPVFNDLFTRLRCALLDREINLSVVKRMTLSCSISDFDREIRQTNNAVHTDFRIRQVKLNYMDLVTGYTLSTAITYSGKNNPFENLVLIGPVGYNQILAERTKDLHSDNLCDIPDYQIINAICEVYNAYKFGKSRKELIYINRVFETYRVHLLHWSEIINHALIKHTEKPHLPALVRNLLKRPSDFLKLGNTLTVHHNYGELRTVTTKYCLVAYGLQLFLEYSTDKKLVDINLKIYQPLNTDTQHYASVLLDELNNLSHNKSAFKELKNYKF